MKHILLIAVVVLMAACGSEDGNKVLNKKKEELKALQDKQKTLEEEIAKLDTAAAKAEKPKLVTVAPIEPVSFTHYIDLQGKVESVDISYVTPRNGTGGQVRELFVKRGDLVKKGQLLLKLDDAITRQSLIAAEQGLATIKTKLAYAENLYQKQKNLWDAKIGTEVQLITAKNNVDLAETELKSAQENIKINKEQLGFTNVYSTVNGVADDVNIRVGETFTGNNQIKIVNTSNLKITAQVPEVYLEKIQVGSNVKVTLPDINKSIVSKVSVAGRLIDPNTRSFFIEAKIPADNVFRPNQIAVVQIQDYSTSNSITVPVNTLQTDDKGKFIMTAVKENNKLVARKRVVTIGDFYDDKLEIKSGLKQGDVIVTDGFQSLYEGQAITTSAN